MNSLFMARGNQLKSIPLQSLPDAAWKILVGGAGRGDESALLDVIETVPWLSRGIQSRCNALAGMPLAVHVGDENGEEVSEKDWPFEINLSALLYALYQDYIVYGRAFTFINKNKLGGVTTDQNYLRRFLPTSITPVMDAVQGITGFVRLINGVKLPEIPPDRIAYWYKPSLRDETGYVVS